MAQRLVLVTGATGNQGSAVTEALLGKGHKVRAMVRKPDGEKALALAAKGVEVVQGTFEDRSAIERAAAGVDTMFALTTPIPNAEAEIGQGEALVDAAKAAGVGHFVFSSVSDADRDTKIPHFDSKYVTETYLKNSGLNWTITAPAYFYDNVSAPWGVGDLKAGAFRPAMPETTVLQSISVRDIGRFNALVIDRGADFYGQRINIAGDALTGPQMASILSASSGKPIKYEPQQVEALRAWSEDMAQMFDWFNKVGYSADIAGLRADYPEVEWSTFEQWASAQDWGKLLG